MFFMLQAADTTAKMGFKKLIENMASMTGNEIIQFAVHGIITVTIKILLALAIYFIGQYLIKRLKKIVRNILEKREIDVSLRSFILSFISITLTLLLIITIVTILGIDTTSFVALFASAGLAIGMALSGTLQNFAGGVLILFLKPFKVGDFIETQGQVGTVKDIHLFNIILNTPDNKTIVTPNGGISNGIINNYSREERRRVDWTFSIAYGDDYDTARELILSLLKADQRVFWDPQPLVALGSLADSSVNLTVRAWVLTSDYWGVYFDMNEKVYKTFSTNGLNIPFPQLDVHMVK
ncbi:MAG: mechanosensitive ion channel [Rikenellaceae bacterium]